MWKCVRATSTKTLGVPIDTDVHLSAVDLGSIHHPAGLLGTLGRVKPHCSAALWLPVLHLDLCEHHLACSGQEWAMNECKVLVNVKLILAFVSERSLWAACKLSNKDWIHTKQETYRRDRTSLSAFAMSDHRTAATHKCILQSVQLSTLIYLRLMRQNYYKMQIKRWVHQ